MLNIIKADLYRIFRGKGIYITFGILVAIIILQAIAGTGTVGMNTSAVVDGATEAEIIESAMEETLAITKANGMAAPFVMAGASANLIYFLIPLIIFSAGIEFSSGAVKNAISRGMSRTKYYFAKLIPALFFAVIIQVFNLIIPTVIATIRHGFGGRFTGEWVVDVLKVYGAQTLIMFAITCVGAFIVFLTRKTSATIGLFIGFLLVPTLILSLLAMISSKLENLINYDLGVNMNLMANLSELPNGDIVRMFVLCAIYIIGATLAGIAIFKKSDIK